jgi:branched-chain amino acid transport system ATP-binding protein
MAVLLQAVNIDKFFGGVKALIDVNIDIMDDQILGVIGPNGAGKTTLFNVLTGFDGPTNGKVLFNGRDVTAKPVHYMSKMGLARTFQNIRLFNAMTVIDNIVVGMHNNLHAGLIGILFRVNPTMKNEKAAYKKGMEILDYLGLADVAQEYAGNLPYGMQRKVEIGRALASDPKLLLLDEPAAGMNPQEMNELMSLIKGIRDMGPSIVLIEHNMPVVMGISERIVCLNFGEVLVDCSPEEAQTDARVIEAYLGQEEEEDMDAS